MSASFMHYLHRISWGITFVGVALVAVALVFDLGAMWLLGGILLAWAGIVKIVVTLIWQHVAHMGTDDHRPTPGT